MGGPGIMQKHCGIGSMVVCMPGEGSQAPEYKAKFPYGGVPGLEDGKWCMSESGAILRYMAREYAEELYPKDPATRARIDWALDRFNFGMYNDATATIYVAMGFASAPEKQEDLEAAGQKAAAALQEFADFFLQKKFVGGDNLSIADFKVAPFFAAYAHQRVRKMCNMEVPARIVTFNRDFLEACPSAKALYEAEDGHSVCQFLDSKTEAEKGGASPTAEDEKLQKAMELEANKEVVDLKDSGVTAENSPEVAAKIEEESAPKGGCYFC